MKHWIRILSLLMILALCTAVFASCAKTLSGTYEGEVDAIVLKYTATYEFSGNKVDITKKTTTILGTVNTVEFSGTYEISENDDGSMEITFTLDSEDEQIKSGTFTFEEGEDYIKIGLAKYTKK